MKIKCFSRKIMTQNEGNMGRKEAHARKETHARKEAPCHNLGSPKNSKPSISGTNDLINDLEPSLKTSPTGRTSVFRRLAEAETISKPLIGCRYSDQTIFWQRQRDARTNPQTPLRCHSNTMRRSITSFLHFRGRPPAAGMTSQLARTFSNSFSMRVIKRSCIAFSFFMRVIKRSCIAHRRKRKHSLARRYPRNKKTRSRLSRHALHQCERQRK